ncbi:MAG TPA: VIT domain-containing protein [Planctomycetota bacterium]
MPGTALLLALGLGGILAGARPASAPAPELQDEAFGRVLDREGDAGRKPVLGQRWSVADAGLRLVPGDWLRTGQRGANALRVQLEGGVELLLGPATQVELAASGRVRLERGELEVVPGRAAFAVEGPGGASLGLRERAVLRARDGRLERLQDDPRWLSGYRSQSSTEALGSLLANVDGREVALSIGYHKVNVDVRDRIARTVVEESFVNHTDATLEGIFYFPLPDDASISGFAMWIDGELAEGEIVEKQRARAIYETILRERRDPGLLEWTGGNLFKARVYPINSEKRVRITYTQILPRQGDAYVYRYGLRSELLRTRPLEQLQIKVTIASAEPIAEVYSPSHACRVRNTEHSASVEFEAQEYVPERDFELRVRAAADAPKVRLVPHVRGEEGYFMLQMAGPELAGQSVEDAPPVELLVLADTSGSMYGPAREAQLDFVAALLGALGPADRFNLATCDVGPRFAFLEPRAADPEAVRAALEFLEARDALGWSDLESGFTSAFERMGADTQLVYVGDGAPTLREADPGAVARALERAWKGRGACHAVVPGNFSEPIVIGALSRLGSGSVRRLADSGDPAGAAYDLLAELATPAVKDLEVSFEGIAVAALHPDRLPNLQAGQEQVLLGRFDASAGPLSGKVVVRGRFGGAEFRQEATVSLAADEDGNSFVPRLWARRHLDHLLLQGADALNRERVIALSVGYQIVTPYTSFLVLESDEDRARFGVGKTFRMRDGEEFFAKGREDAQWELRREQMKVAKVWRQERREALLRELGDMNRGLTASIESVATGGPVSRTAEYGAVGGRGGGGRYRGAGDTLPPSRLMLGAERDEAGEYLPQEDLAALDELGYSEEPVLGDSEWDGDDRAKNEEAFEPSSGEDMEVLFEKRKSLRSPSAPASLPEVSRQQALRPDDGRTSGLSYMPSDAFGLRGGLDGFFRQMQASPFANLFPHLRPPQGAAGVPAWPAEVLAALATIDRRAVIAAGAGVFQIETRSYGVDARGRAGLVLRGESWLSQTDWLSQLPTAPGAAATLEWVLGEERGVLHTLWDLGRIRAAEKGDAAAWRAPFHGLFGEHLASYAGWDASLVDLEGGLVEVRMRVRGQDPASEIVLRIDPQAGRLLEVRHLAGAKVGTVWRYSGWHQAGGLEWPARIESGQPDSTATSVVEVKVRAIDAEALRRATRAQLEPRASRWFRPALADAEGAEARLAAAKQAVADGGAGDEDRWILLDHFAASQRWEDAQPHYQALLESAGSRAGAVVLRLTWLRFTRERETLRLELLERARTLAAAPAAADLERAAALLALAADLDPGNERRELLLALRPVFDRQPAAAEAGWTWGRDMAGCLQRMARGEALFALRRKLATEYPFQVEAHVDLADERAQRGLFDQAFAGLAQAEAEHGPWTPYERQRFHTRTAHLFWNAYRLEDFVDAVEGWERSEPELLDVQVRDMYLSALVMLDRAARADALMRAWIEDAPARGLEGVARARLQAALNHALGYGHSLQRARLEDAEAELLAANAPRFADGLQEYWITQRILGDWRFRGTDAGAKLRREMRAAFEREFDRLDAGSVERRAGWIAQDERNEEGERAWQALLDRIAERWRASEDSAEREILARTVLAYGRLDLRLAVLRERLEQATEPAQRRYAAAALLDGLHAAAWSEAVREEMLGLVLGLEAVDPELDGAAEQNRDARALALWRVVDWMMQAHTAALVAAQPGVESLARRQLAAIRTTALAEARATALQRLQALEGAAPDADFAAWVGIESTWLRIKLRRDFARSWTDTLTALRASLAGSTTPPRRSRVLAARRAATLLHLLARAPADDQAARAAELEALARAIRESESELLAWREFRAMLLTVVDDPAGLEKALAGWYEGGRDFDKMRWGIELGYLFAENDKLTAAAALFGEIAVRDELGRADWRTLAGWLQALDRRPEADAAKIASWAALGENDLRNRLYADVRANQRSGDAIPPDLDPEVVLRVHALLRKAAWPQNSVWHLQALYGSTRDFRILEALPQAVIGHSAQAIYPFLGQLKSVIDMIQDEATFDRMQAHLETLHELAESAEDRRGLRMFEFLLAHRAATQNQGAAPHVQTALRALDAALKDAWAEGEPAQFAAFLADLGALQPAALGNAQIEALAAVHGALAADHPDRAQVGWQRARSLWDHGRQDAALRLLEGALAELRGLHAGGLPTSANGYLSSLGSWHQALGAWRRAESLWLDELRRDVPVTQRRWLELQLMTARVAALNGKGEVSLGAGLVLYEALLGEFARQLRVRTDENHASQLVRLHVQMMQSAHQHLKFRRAVADLRLFAFSELPEIMALYQYRSGQGMVGVVAQAFRELDESTLGLAFLATRAENEPAWLVRRNQDFWGQHAWEFGRMRSAAGRLPRDLEARVLAVVLRELRLELRSRQSRSRVGYHADWSHYWGAKADDFAAVAAEVLAEQGGNEAAVRYVASYYWDGLKRRDAAADALSTALRRGILGLDGRDHLCGYLEELGRHAAAVPLLQELVAARPNQAAYHARLVRALARSDRRDAARATLAAAEAWFREHEAWREDVVAELAQSAVDVGFSEVAIDLYGQAINLHTRGRSDRGVGDGTLSHYYLQRSQVQAQLGRTIAAVDDAAGAIVAWGADDDSRRGALTWLERLLTEAEDLPAYVRHLEAEVEANGLENPILRRALGKALAARGEHAAAAVHLRLAVEAAPMDFDARRALVAALSRAGRGEESLAAWLGWARAAGHDMDLWTDLAQAIAEHGGANGADRSERAYTNVVELFPNESESHQKLAQVREEQGRLAEAESEWRQVVRVRTGEPAGYLGLVRVLVLQGKGEAAAGVAREMLGRDWDERFGDVAGQLRAILPGVRQ